MKKVIHRSEERGHANHGWLDARHSFSFASYYHPDKVHFGALRVLNDDIVAPAMGFSQHPHDNMEIITIPLSGALKHKDSMGNGSVIQQGEVQVMSAGKGVFHSEMNGSTTEPVNLFQIWIFPNKKDVEPRYDQITYELEQDELVQVVSPTSEDAGTWIHQNAWIHLGQLGENKELRYSLHDKNSGVYILVIEGSISIAGEELTTKDAIGISEIEDVTLHASSDTRLLVLEVPMIF